MDSGDKIIRGILNDYATSGLIQIIRNQVMAVRNELTEEYPLSEGSTCDQFCGLCDTAVEKLFERMREIDAKYDAGIICIGMHGEMAHKPICPRSHWPMQHTWGVIKKDDVTIYVDPTSSQFKHVYKDIPDFYVGTEPPKWYYDDRKNPAWNGISRWMNEHIKIPRCVGIANERHWVKDGIVEFLQYEFWGRISDFIRNHNPQYQS